jgi:hypothetical protein
MLKEERKHGSVSACGKNTLAYAGQFTATICNNDAWIPFDDDRVKTISPLPLSSIQNISDSTSALDIVNLHKPIFRGRISIRVYEQNKYITLQGRLDFKTSMQLGHENQHDGKRSCPVYPLKHKVHLHKPFSKHRHWQLLSVCSEGSVKQPDRGHTQSKVERTKLTWVDSLAQCSITKLAMLDSGTTCEAVIALFQKESPAQPTKAQLGINAFHFHQTFHATKIHFTSTLMGPQDALPSDKK